MYERLLSGCVLLDWQQLKQFFKALSVFSWFQLWVSPVQTAFLVKKG